MSGRLLQLTLTLTRMADLAPGTINKFGIEITLVAFKASRQPAELHLLVYAITMAGLVLACRQRPFLQQCFLVADIFHE